MTARSCRIHPKTGGHRPPLQNVSIFYQPPPPPPPDDPPLELPALELLESGVATPAAIPAAAAAHIPVAPAPPDNPPPPLQPVSADAPLEEVSVVLGVDVKESVVVADDA